MQDDFGMSVSLPGYDATTAQDQFLYFNSAWPLIKIDTDLSGTMTLQGSSSVDFITHNLGYPPLCFVWSHANGFYPYYIFAINSTQLIFNGTAGDEVQYYICRNPLNINFKAQSINIAGSGEGQSSPDFGIKFAKPGYDASSTDYRNFTIHSATKSLQVHQVIYQQISLLTSGTYSGNYGLIYNSELSYNPMYMAFFSEDNQNFSPLFATSQTAPKINYDQIDNGIVINNAAGSTGWGVFYIFLDPYQTTNSTTVSIA